MRGFFRRFCRHHIRAIIVLAAGALVNGGSAFAAARLELPPIGDRSRVEHHIGKMIWADLVTPDLTAAERFYGGLFGWTFKSIHAGGEDYAVAILDGRPIGGLLQRPVPAGEQRQPAWLTFIAVRDVDAAERTAIAQGAKSVSAPRTYAGRGRQAVLADPEGAIFGVLASTSGDPADFLSPPGDWIWSSVHTGDPGQSAAFYQAVFGYDVFDIPGDDDHFILSSDDYARASANPLPPQGHRHAHWLNFVRVLDAAESARKAAALGGRILVEPHVDRHGERIAVVADATGAPIGLMEWSDTDSKVEPK